MSLFPILGMPYNKFDVGDVDSSSFLLTGSSGTLSSRRFTDITDHNTRHTAMSLHHVVSTGRGGAGNMFSANDANAANEVIMTQEEFEKYNNSHKNGRRTSHGKNDVGEKMLRKESIVEENEAIEEERMYNHDKHGRIIASSGRGGAGNIGRFDKLPSPKIKSDLQEMELSPVFSTGRGGAGNIYKTKSQTKTKIKLSNEIDDQLSPLHSQKSNRSTSSNRRNSDSHHDGNIMKKIRKFFK